MRRRHRQRRFVLRPSPGDLVHGQDGTSLHRGRSGRRPRSSPAGRARLSQGRRAAAGPVTLAQARALASLAVPLPKGGKAALVPASPARVGVERRKLAAEAGAGTPPPHPGIQGHARNHEEARREGTGAEGRRRAGARRKAAAKPLQVFAEGDSWFDYPVPFFGGGIIPRLENKLGVPILNLAKAGDEVRYMLGVKERKLSSSSSPTAAPPAGRGTRCCSPAAATTSSTTRWRCGSGTSTPTLPPAALIHQGRFDAALALVRAGYEDLIGAARQPEPADAPRLPRLRLRHPRRPRHLPPGAVAEADLRPARLPDARRRGSPSPRSCCSSSPRCSSRSRRRTPR